MSKKRAVPPPQAEIEKTQASNYLDWLTVCCRHARDAIRCGRLHAANGLYLTATQFFDCALALISSHSDTQLDFKLQQARLELDSCAHGLGPIRLHHPRN